MTLDLKHILLHRKYLFKKRGPFNHCLWLLLTWRTFCSCKHTCPGPVIPPASRFLHPGAPVRVAHISLFCTFPRVVHLQEGFPGRSCRVIGPPLRVLTLRDSFLATIHELTYAESWALGLWIEFLSALCLPGGLSLCPGVFLHLIIMDIRGCLLFSPPEVALIRSTLEGSWGTELKRKGWMVLVSPMTSLKACWWVLRNKIIF